MTFTFDAVLLAGGRAARLGGLDKTSFTIDGETLAGRAAAAAHDARALVIVGLRAGVRPPEGVILTREEPPWSGPAAALAAGVAALPTPASAFTLVLACDLVRAREAVGALLAAAPPSSGWRDGVQAVDEDGRSQPLLAIYRTAALTARFGALSQVGTLEGMSLRRLLDGLDLLEIPVDGDLCADVDTHEDARRLGVGGAPGSSAG